MFRYTWVNPPLASLHSRLHFEKIDFITYTAVIETRKQSLSMNYMYFFIQASNWQRFEDF